MNVVGYVRLSRDEDKENYSSIINQKKIIQNFADKNGYLLREFFVDDNVSGYTFDRPAFKQLLYGMESNTIDIILAKDLSRIGRHNAKTLLFLEDVRKLNKRLILIDEGNGGFDTSQDDDDIIGIKTWYNERYVKDISKKIISSIRVKQSEGKLFSRDFFGYIRETKAKDRLIIDEENAEVVKLIFKLYIDGYGYKKVAEHLNEKGFPTPSQVLRSRAELKGKLYGNKVKELWTGVNVQRIIKDDIYIGTMRFGKTRKQSIKGKSVRVSDSEQFIFENFHQPIINLEDFELAQRISEKRNVNNFRGGKKSINLFSGFLFCSDCGSYMVRANSANKPRAYVCGKYHNQNSKTCGRHHIREDKLILMIKEHLAFLEMNFMDTIKKIEEKLMKGQFNDNSLNSKLSRLIKEHEQVNDEIRLLLMQKIRDLVGRPEYEETIESNYRIVENEKLTTINFLEKQINETRERIKDLQKRVDMSNGALSIFSQIINSEELKRSDLELLIDKIVVDKVGNIEIFLNADIDCLCNSQADIELVSFIEQVSPQ